MIRQTRREFLAWCTVGMCGAGRVWSAVADGSSGTAEITFAAINDTHVREPSSVAILERAVAHINADERVAFAVVLGDIGTDGASAELNPARDALSNLTCPWRAVPGNHDVAVGDADIYGNYKAAFGDTHWVHSFLDWTFIGFDSCEGTKSFVTVADAEVEWLRAQAAKVPADRPVALFCHHPLNPNTRNYRILNADAVLDIFSGHQVRIAAAGHWHGNQVEEQAGTVFTTTACCATTRTNFDSTEARGYRLFHLQGDTVVTEFVEIPLVD